VKRTALVRPALVLVTALLASCSYGEAESPEDLLRSASGFLASENASLQLLQGEGTPAEPEAAPLEARDRAPAQIRGIYVTAYTVAREERLQEFLDLAARTEINTFVVDVKTENGVHFRSEHPLARELTRAGHAPIASLSGLVERLHANGIHTIARIVAFKDPDLVAARPAWAIKRPDGGTWVDREGNRWVSPWHPEVWKYNIDIAAEAARAGFAEIQFDYIRFPEQYRSLPLQVHPASTGGDRTDAIAGFLRVARERLHPLGVTVTADVFGMSMNEAGDVGIGQQWERLSAVTDHLLPMVYPSHYFSTHLPGISRPNRMPRQTIETAVGMGVIRNDRLEAAGVRPARIIPWLQAFDAPWVDRDFPYGPDQVRAQIEAVYEVGLEDWIFWHPGSRYSHLEAAFERELAPRARNYAAPESLQRRMDLWEGWGMRADRERAIAGAGE
jgi:hypothetical protein